MAQIRAVNRPGRLSLRHPPPPPLNRPPNENSEYRTKAPAPARNGIAQGHQLQCKEKRFEFGGLWPNQQPAPGRGRGWHKAQCLECPPASTYMYIWFQLTVLIICHCTPQHTIAHVMHEMHSCVSISVDEMQVAHHHFHLMSQHYP